MALIYELGKIMAEAKAEYEAAVSAARGEAESAAEKIVLPEVNLLLAGDNFDWMLKLRMDEGLKDKIKLIYIDPPFYTKANYSAKVSESGETVEKPAYEDRWANAGEYIKTIAVRLFLMRDILADDGLIYLHADGHAVHALKLVMDEIFGEANFVNEVIWQYKSGGAGKKSFARKHDNILVYAKGRGYRFFPQKEKSYNRGLKPYRFKGVEESCDDVGWYTMVNMKDVWSINMIGRTSGERTGYATQKPIKLMERIIASTTEEGDICADFFCGSGSLGVAAAAMGRKFIMCDKGETAISMTEERLRNEGVPYVLIDERARGRR